MAAKKKTKKAQKKKKAAENEILVYIYALVLITLSIIGCLEIGFLGNLITGVIQYVTGNLYGVVYGLIIVFSFMWMLKKNISDVPLKYTTGVIVLLSAWLIAASLPNDEKLTGMDILSHFLGNSAQVFHGEQIGGGLIGAFLVSITTFLVDYTGTKIIIIALVVLGCILLISGPLFAYLRQGASAFQKPFSSMKENAQAKREQRRNKKALKKEEKVEKTSEQANTTPAKESMFGKINLEERVRPGQVSFLDVDDEFDIITDGRNDAFEPLASSQNAHEEEDEVVIGFGAASKAVQQQKEDKRIIEETIGKSDTFVSSFKEDWSKYKLPKLTLLNDIGKKARSTANIKAANESGQRLIEILDEFGVRATLMATHIGPSVTKFEVKPDLGVRVNKISNLQYDIKMALAAKDIRIEAPIPGKSAVGIEIPNMEKTSVSMKELMKSVPEKYQDKKMLFALGKDLMGSCVYGELNKMPHLLIAGATGSGKSVCVNSIITSILMRARPDEVKLLLVDPKKVEFTPYKQIPHLLGPVITDGEEANRALKVIVAMMDKRYELFAMAGVRNIAGYNTYIENHPEDGLEKLPWIVVIIDELADLMLVAAKEVEASIQRITQLARAAGIHLIVATQRPSVDVITGVIKANIPSRIAFAVSSAVDSRTILDQMGAEKLLGYGDMLYIPVGETNPTRVQGVFVSDAEVQSICDFVSAQGKPKYEDAFLRLEAVDSEYAATQESADPLYEEVKSFIISTRKASTSLIQRKFSIGYARAARLIDVLEEQGVIGPSRGSKPREVLVRYEEDDFDE